MGNRERPPTWMCGSPVLTLVERDDCRHYVVVYGVGRNQDRVCLAGNAFPVVGRKVYTRAEFEFLYVPEGCKVGVGACYPRKRAFPWIEEPGTVTSTV